MRIDGVQGIKLAMRRLGPELQRKAEKPVLRAGAKPILKAAKQKVARESGLLAKALGTNVKKLNGETTARVGARKGRGKLVNRGGRQVFSDPVKYSHLVELGTSHSAAQPFLRPAVESTKGQISEAMADGLDKYLTRTVRRLRSK